MIPYYQDTNVTIYHGDCREIVPLLSRFDLLLTDPPYGIDAAGDKRGGKQHGKALAPSRSYGTMDWDKRAPAAWVLEMCREKANWAILWGGNFYERLPPASGWLVWDKVNGKNGYADCELAWTNLPIAVRKFRYQWMGMLQEHMDAKEARYHPTQKPLPLMTWCILLVSDVQTILDPFAGSGTTGRAAKDLGRQAVLIEREERYCEIAVRRMAQEVLSLGPPAASVRESRLVIDHIVPIAQGGKTELANLRTLCQTCNAGKGVRREE